MWRLSVWVTCIAPLLSGGKLVELTAVTAIDNEFWLAGTNQIYRCGSGAGSCVSVTAGMTGAWAYGNFAGTTATDFWFSGLDRAFHYNGTAWTVHPSLKARTIHQVRKDDVWVGDTTLQHWNGAAWSSEYSIDGSPAPGLIVSISGSGASDLWAAGNQNNAASFAAHWDGTKWSLRQD
ncbi:hypothetical protein BH11MYX4_BH11MYX4_14050 [soil metagenome]